MTEELAKILRELHASGQNTALFLVIGLVLLVVIVAGLVWFQRQIIKKLEMFSRASADRLKEVEALMQAAGDARAESREAQKSAQGLMKDQFDVVIRTNDELRKEIGRVGARQESFEGQVKTAISVGFKDVKERLGDLSVSEILEGIPGERFRQDLQGEINETSERVIHHLVERLKEAPDDLIDEKALLIVVERTVHAVMREHVFPMMSGRGREEYEWHMRHHGHIPPEYWEKYGLAPWPWLDERWMDEFARRVAHHLRDRYY